MRIAISLAAFLISQIALFAQQDTSFSITYGTINEDRGAKIRLASDGNLLIVGSTAADEQNSGSDMYLLKVDTLGRKLWSLAVGANEIEQATDVVEMNNGNYLLVGYSNSFSLGDYDVFVAQVSAAGALLSLDTYGGSDWDQAYGVTATADGGFVIVGESYSYQNGISQGLVIKLNAAGTLEWMNNWGGSFNDGFYAVENLASGVIVAAGYTEVENNGKDIWVVGISVFGDSLWTRTIGSSADEEALDIGINSGQFIGLVGYTTRQGLSKDFYFVALDNNLDSAFDFLGSYSDVDVLTGITIDDFDGFVISGYTNSTSLGVINYDVTYYRIRDDGVFVYGTTFGYAQNEFANSILSGSTSGFYFLGTTDSHGQGLNDIWLLRALEFDTFSLRTPELILDTVSLLTSAPDFSTASATSLKLYPNPLRDQLTIETGSRLVAELMTTNGQLLRQLELNRGENRVDLQDLPVGTYFISFTDQSNHTTIQVIQKK